MPAMITTDMMMVMVVVVGVMMVACWTALPPARRLRTC